MLRCLVQSYGRNASEDADKRLYLGTAIDLMEILTQVGPYLASLPASHAHPGVNAGVTFTMLRDVQRLPRGPGEKRMMAERVAEMSRHAHHLFREGHELNGVCEALERMLAAFAIPDLRTVGRVHGPTPPPKAEAPPPPKPDDLPSGAGGKVEIAEGRSLTVRFEGKRCIHSRHCVLEAPRVFRANTPGEWIFPDAMDTEAVVRIAYECPSGAIRFARKDGGLEEQPPPVNTAGIRENGPYAFCAPMTLAGTVADVGFRATLCRCGASKNKPFCDGSHNTIGFKASGEPETRKSEPLAVRDGPLVIDPQKNGPLQVVGNLEIISGTGRTIDRVAKARLCRCGGSRTKPFCDNTHLKIGFTADGN
jgi:CDGSH-type Zn-finger protein/uncharacterized Fe-S cluster protein YjdI